MTAFLIALAVAGGFFLPVQAGINAGLRGHLQSPVQAALVSFTVGTLGLAAYVLIERQPWPSLAELWRVPPLLWTGGLMGAFFVAMSVVLAPRLGAAVMIAYVIAGQLTASALLDHFGWLGYPVHELTWPRLLGLALLAAGAALVKLF